MFLYVPAATATAVGRGCGHGRTRYLAACMHSTYGVYVLVDAFGLSQLLFLNDEYVLGCVCILGSTAWQ